MVEATRHAIRNERVAENLIVALMDENGALLIARVAEAFGMSKGQLAETVGLGQEAFYKQARERAPKTQSRVREMLEIISRLELGRG
jgi:DNA-binding phage protein